MPELALYTFFASIVSMILFAVNYRMEHYNGKGVPQAALFAAAVLAPFGALAGQLLWRTPSSRNNIPLLIVSIALTAALPLLPLFVG